MAKSKTAAKAKTVKSAVGSAGKSIAAAALAAIGLTLGKDAIASTEQAERRDINAPELLDEKLSQVEASVSEKDRLEQESPEVAEREPSESGEVVADRGEGGKDFKALAGREPVLLADASSALGRYSDQPLLYAQVSPASASNAAGAGGGAAAGGAGAVAEGVAGAAATVGGISAAPVIGAIAVGAAVGAGGGGAVAVATAAVAAPVAAVAGGLAAKGILSGATVFYDFNGDGQFTAGVDPSGTTNALGKYSINLTDAQKTQVETGLDNMGKALKLVVTGGTDTVSGLPFTGSLSSIAPKDTADEGKINVFTTMKASGVSDKVLTEMLGGRSLDSLTDGDFDSADGVEAIAMKLWALVSNKVGGDADKAEAAFAAVSSILEKLDAAGGDLNALLGDGGSLGAGELESLFGTAIDKSVALYDANPNLTDAQLAALMDNYANELGGALDGFVDGDVSAQDEADLIALQGQADAAADTLATNLDGTSADILAVADRYGATIGYNTAGDAVSFILDETDAQLLLDQGVNDPFAAFGNLDLILQVDGTLLGTADNPLTIAGLQALGVDGLSDGTDSLAPYLRLTEGNFTNVGSDLAFLSSIDLGADGIATGSLPVYVDGTIYSDDSAAFDSLNVIGIDAGNNADVFHLLGDYSLGT